MNIDFVFSPVFFDRHQMLASLGNHSVLVTFLANKLPKQLIIMLTTQ